MAKDRYHFDEQFNIDDFHVHSYDDKLLSTAKDPAITARREARKARLAKESDRRVIMPEDIQTGKKKKRHKVRVGRVLLFSAAVIAVLAFVGVQGVKLTKLQLEKKEAQKELEVLEQKVEQLEDELLELDSDEYVENAARSELHMIKDGEVMYIVDPGQEDTQKNTDGAKPE